MHNEDKPTLMQQAAPEIRRRRRFLGLSQAELAIRAGTSRHTIVRIEAGRANISIELFQAIADILKLDAGIYLRPRPNSLKSDTQPR